MVTVLKLYESRLGRLWAYWLNPAFPICLGMAAQAGAPFPAPETLASLPLPLAGAASAGGTNLDPLGGLFGAVGP